MSFRFLIISAALTLTCGCATSLNSNREVAQEKVKAEIRTTASAERTVKGKEARAIVYAVNVVTNGGENANAAGFEYDSNGSNEALQGDEVTANYTQFSGKIGNKMVMCTANEYMIYKVSKQNKDKYVDEYECKIK